MKAIIYNQKGEKTGDFELQKGVFDLPWNEDLVYQVVVAMQANKRTPVAHAKGRGDVRGGGRKPWRQKGTGRARHGSRRSPIWIGGGVTHGPTKEKDYSQKINKKMKQKAFLTALSLKARNKEILFLDKIALSETKTKEAHGIIKSLSKIGGFERLSGRSKNKVVVALPKKEEAVARSFRNLPGVQVSEARNLNILDLMSYKYFILINPKEINFIK